MAPELLSTYEYLSKYRKSSGRCLSPQCDQGNVCIYETVNEHLETLKVRGPQRNTENYFFPQNNVLESFSEYYSATRSVESGQILNANNGKLSILVILQCLCKECSKLRSYFDYVEGMENTLRNTVREETRMLLLLAILCSIGLPYLFPALYRWGIFDKNLESAPDELRKRFRTNKHIDFFPAARHRRAPATQQDDFEAHNLREYEHFEKAFYFARLRFKLPKLDNWDAIWFQDDDVLPVRTIDKLGERGVGSMQRITIHQFYSHERNSRSEVRTHDYVIDMRPFVCSETGYRFLELATLITFIRPVRLIYEPTHSKVISSSSPSE